MNRTTRVTAVLLMLMMGISSASMGWKLLNKHDGTITPSEAIEFRLSDDGDATASKYIRAYCRNLAELSKRTADSIRTTDEDSFAIASEWSKASETARKEASKGVDARVSAMIEAGTSREDCAKFQDQVTAAFERMGK